MDWNEVHSALESILFAAGDPVSLERLSQALELDMSQVKTALEELQDDYRFHQRGLRIVSIQDSYQMTSAPEHAPLVRSLLEKRKGDKLSPAALEALAIVAYYQPVTRTYVEQVRGVDSSYTMGLLLDRELIEECGRLDVPGRPILYRTGVNFLRSFGLQSLDELPELPVLEGDGSGKDIQQEEQLRLEDLVREGPEEGTGE